MYINPLSYELYKFVLEFLKLQKSSFSKKEKRLIFSVTMALVFYLFFVGTILLRNILGIKISAILMVFSICVTTYYTILFKKEQQKINPIRRQLKKYKYFKQQFREKYGMDIEEILLNQTIDDLSKIVELEIERSKYTFDKILSIMTLTPVLAALFSFGKNSANDEYDYYFVSIIIVVVVMAIFVIYSYTKSIYFPQFKEVEKKQRVLSFLKGCLLEIKIKDDISKDIVIENNREDEKELVDSKNRSLYREIHLLLGVFSYYSSHRNDENKLLISFLWDMLKIDFKKTEIQRECNIKILWKLIDIFRKSEWE